MPQYIYKHPKKEEYVEIIQRMTEEHVYLEDGIQWQRVFTVPQGNVDTKIDPYNRQQFLDKTRNKKGSIGDLWAESKELSEKRGGGINDPIKKKYYEDYSKNRKGKTHRDLLPSEVKLSFKGPKKK